MSVWTSLYTGASGLGAHSKAISVVGDNIANVSTVGFKAARASFGDVIGNRSPTGRTLGAGVSMHDTTAQLGQGSFLNTGGRLDFAITGEGFFAVAGSHNGANGTFYTRDGRFTLDAQGYVVSPGGLRLQGYELDTQGQVSGPAGNIQLGGTVPPVPTGRIDINVNLDAGAPVSGPFDPLDPGGTSSFSTSVTVYDSLGSEHRVDLYFVNGGGGDWEWHAMVDGGELAGGTAGEATEIAEGTLSFTAGGLLDTETILSSTADFVGAEPNQAVEFDFGDAITTDAGTGLGGSTQYSSASSVNTVAQDGAGAGQLVDVIVAEDGTISGVYSNGQSQPMARVALASFASPGGLFRAGDGIFTATPSSGDAVLGEPTVGGRGSIATGALEGSNVDLGAELVTLIAYQRAFQANARTISTADEMLTEIANIKR